MDDGSVHSIDYCANNRFSKIVNNPRDNGMLPVTRLLCNCKDNRSVNNPIDDGISPVN
jgi:hypothetical protein